MSTPKKIAIGSVVTVLSAQSLTTMSVQFDFPFPDFAYSSLTGLCQVGIVVAGLAIAAFAPQKPTE